jgi:SHS2 domain-containing protein
MPRGHRQIDHTADLALELWGESEEDVLRAGAEGVIAIMTEGGEVEERGARHVHIDAVDPHDRLVQWLNEIIVAAVSRGFLFGSADIALEGRTGLSATIRGEPDAGGRVVGELKSATYHDLELGPEPGGGGTWRARVVIDV